MVVVLLVASIVCLGLLVVYEDLRHDEVRRAEPKQSDDEPFSGG